MNLPEHFSRFKINVCFRAIDNTSLLSYIIKLVLIVMLFSNRTVKPGTICIDSSTISIEASKNIAKLCEASSINFIDAPVSGGTVGAQNGTLTFMCGVKNQELFESAKPILQAMGKNIVYVGENGHGLAAKICNNMMLGISMIGVAETMNLGKK